MPDIAMQDDCKQIDRVIADFFSAFDNRNGRNPEADEMTRLFADKAIIAKHHDGDCELFSPDEFAAPRVALLRGGSLVAFHEWEESANTQVVGAIATRTSRYAKSGLLDGDPYAGTGTKIFQLSRFRAGWRIVALSWIDDA